MYTVFTFLCYLHMYTKCIHCVDILVWSTQVCNKCVPSVDIRMLSHKCVQNVDIRMLSHKCVHSVDIRMLSHRCVPSVYNVLTFVCCHTGV